MDMKNSMYISSNIKRITLISETFLIMLFLLLISICILLSPLKEIGLIFWIGMFVMSIICFIGSLPYALTRTKVELKENYIDISVETHKVLWPIIFIVGVLSSARSGQYSREPFLHRRAKIESNYIIKTRRGFYRLRKIIVFILGLFCLFIVISPFIATFIYHITSDILEFFGGMFVPLVVCAFLYVLKSDVAIIRPDGSIALTISGLGKTKVKEVIETFLSQLKSH